MSSSWPLLWDLSTCLGVGCWVCVCRGVCVCQVCVQVEGWGVAQLHTQQGVMRE
jgi:hypothetical protein